MIKPLTLISFVLVLFYMSCDPTIGVVIANKSGANKRVTVKYPPNFWLPTEWKTPEHDSIEMYQLINRRIYPFLLQPILSLDTNAHTYSFVVKPGYGAVVEYRALTLFPTYGQVFIIDNTDTVLLKRHGKEFKRTPKLLLTGGIWTHEIR